MNTKNKIIAILLAGIVATAMVVPMAMGDTADQSVTVSYTTAPKLVQQAGTGAISTITASGAAGATVGDPYNDQDTSDNPQNIDGTMSNDTPVCTIRNDDATNNYKIWVKVTAGANWDDAVTDEMFGVGNVEDGHSDADGTGFFNSLKSWGDLKDSGQTIAKGGHWKDLYLKYTLNKAGTTGASTITVLGEG